MQCVQCLLSDMQVPLNGHPAYLICPTCGAIELTYVPQDYQSMLHETSYVRNDDPETEHIWPYNAQLIGCFGG